MPRIERVQKSRKPLTCGHCQTAIPIGSPYQSIKPRYGSRKVRCMQYACRFRPSDLSSAKTAIIHDAIEDAVAAISAASNHDDIQSALLDVANVARDVSDEYQEASDNWAGGSNEEFQEKADSCSSFADDLESWEYSGETDEEEIRNHAEGESVDEAWKRELDRMRDEAVDALWQFDL